jgi:hypothetical protein
MFMLNMNKQSTINQKKNGLRNSCEAKCINGSNQLSMLSIMKMSGVQAHPAG